MASRGFLPKFHLSVFSPILLLILVGYYYVLFIFTMLFNNNPKDYEKKIPSPIENKYFLL